MADSNLKHPSAGIRVIRSRADYEEMRRELDRLLDLDPPRGSPERDRLDVLLVLLADYETRELAPPSVDPVDAILFRMDQLGLKTRDLEPYLGGLSRVSEVLARKRPLSIGMIRALHEGLGIPAEALINPAAPPQEDPAGAQIPWERFPIRQMIARGWLSGERATAWTRDSARELLTPFFASAGARQLATIPLYRRSAHVRAAKDMDDFALAAWTARVLRVAKARHLARRFDPRALEPEQVRSLVQLSRLEEGPRLAREWLADHGMIMVVESHLPKTLLDGAAMLADDGTPVIALTIRYDRLDNFWFTLLHECAHVLRHLVGAGGPTGQYYDDLDVDDKGDSREREADSFARESLVPSAPWQASAVAFAPSADAAIALADELGVSPAVIAGRVRHEKGGFLVLGPIVGPGGVRRLFPDGTFD